MVTRLKDGEIFPVFLKYAPSFFDVAVLDDGLHTVLPSFFTFVALGTKERFIVFAKESEVEFTVLSEVVELRVILGFRVSLVSGTFQVILDSYIVICCFLNRSGYHGFVNGCRREFITKEKPHVGLHFLRCIVKETLTDIFPVRIREIEVILPVSGSFSLKVRLIGTEFKNSIYHCFCLLLGFESSDIRIKH